MLRTILLVALVGVRRASAAVCSRAGNETAWAFQAPQGHSHPSCISTAGGTNDLGTTPHMCEGDPASVRIETTPGKAECLVAYSADCKIPMREFASLDYDFSAQSCNGVWAAPLWMTPDTWQWGPKSGEIDSLEFCPRSGIHLNFAGGGHQTAAAGLSIDGAEAHVTVRKDPAAIVTITQCTRDVAAANGGQCPAPVYSDCTNCLKAANQYACWCDVESQPPTANIYGSGGCVPGTDCMWTLVSDIWNGVAGDSGYTGCMGAVPGVVGKMQPHLRSNCALSVERIVLRGSGPNGSLRWGPGSPAYCADLTTSTTTSQVGL